MDTPVRPISQSSYAVPRLPVPLPDFSMQQPLTLFTAFPGGTNRTPSQTTFRHPQAAHSGLHMPEGAAVDVETMRLALSRLSSELDSCHCRLEECGQEKELLVAERTQLVVQLQVNVVPFHGKECYPRLLSTEGSPHQTAGADNCPLLGPEQQQHCEDGCVKRGRRSCRRPVPFHLVRRGRRPGS